MHFKPFQSVISSAKVMLLQRKSSSLQSEQPGQMSSLSFTPTTDIHASQVETVNLSPSFHQIIATI